MIIVLIKDCKGRNGGKMVYEAGVRIDTPTGVR